MTRFTDLKKLLFFILLAGCTTGGLGPIAPMPLAPQATSETTTEPLSQSEGEAEGPVAIAAIQENSSGTTLPVISSTPGTVLCNFGVFVVHVASPSESPIQSGELCIQVEILDEATGIYADLASQKLFYWTEIFLAEENKWVRTPRCGEAATDWEAHEQKYEFHLYMIAGESWKPGNSRDEQCPQYPDKGFAIEAIYKSGEEELHSRREGLTPGHVPNNFPGHILPDPIELHWLPYIDLGHTIDAPKLQKTSAIGIPRP